MSNYQPFIGFPAQDRLVEAMLSGQYDMMLGGGSIMSGKTKAFIAGFVLLSQAFPGSKWVMGRKDWPKLRSTVMEAFHDVCPPALIVSPFNEKTREIVLRRGSRILWKNEATGVDKAKPFQGLYVNGAFLSEADELASESRDAARSRCGSYKGSYVMRDGQKIFPPALFAMDCNPNQGPLKTDFYLAEKNGTLPANRYFQNFKIRENPYITEKDFERFKDWPVDLVARFIDGDWDAVSDALQLIPWDTIHKAYNEVEDTGEGGYSLGVDVAREGDDRLVYQLIEGNNFGPIEIKTYESNLVNISDRIEWYMNEYRIPASRVVVDGVGLGAGVVDVLWKREKYVVNFVGGASATAKPWETVFTYKNLKAQGYHLLSQKLEKGELGNLKNEVMKSELASIRKKVEEREFRVESKKDYKKRVGKSPDLSDAAVYACWARFHEELHPVLSAGFV